MRLARAFLPANRRIAFARDPPHNHHAAQVVLMGLVASLLLFAALLLIALPLWTLISLRTLKEDRDALRRRVAAIEEQLRQLRANPPPAATLTPAEAPPTVSVQLPPITPPALPPLLPSAPPPPDPAPPPVSTPPTRAPDLEQFVGAKLFAWLGGLTAFLAVAFFVKYSFEHDLIPPHIRIAIGFVLGAALVAVGLRIKAEKYRVLAHMLCATGIVSLYAVTFASHVVYRFPFFTAPATFLLMALLTAAAFLLAVRLNAAVVAILGLLAGFLTPILVSTGEDQPLALFGYIALLDLGLAAAALHRRWHCLVPFAAVGTVALLIGWTDEFFTPARAPLLIGLCLGFCALFGLVAEASRRWQRPSRATTGTAIALPFVAFAFAFYLLASPTVSARAGLFFTFIFAADACLLWLAWRDALAVRVHLAASAVVFALLALWTGVHLTEPLLPWALAAFLLFALLHTAFPLLLERQRPAAAPTIWSQAFPPLALGLMLLPLLKFDTVGHAFWPAMLLIGVLATALAWLSASVAALTLVLAITFAAAAISIFKTPVTADGTTSLFLLGAVALFFFAAGAMLARRFASANRPRTSIPTLSALLPFVLLLIVTQRLDVQHPTLLFALALLLVILVLGLTRWLALAWLPACALIGVAAVEYAWHARFFDAAHPFAPLSWNLGYYALFAAFPFFFRHSFLPLTGPWAVAALSGVVHFPLVYGIVKTTWPNDAMGLLPAAFALAPAASLVAIARTSPSPATASARLDQLAWFGGVTLLFLTLIFPIQFERQWITIAWALEGAALLWLFRRVPHPGLRATGVVLLVLAFVRLALNPAVLAYQPRGDMPIFNWYLYAYGLTIAALFTGARLLPPAERALRVNARALLNALGTLLSFLLLNIEIADYFSPAGAPLSFDFSGHFARDLAYTVGWASFALALLGAGIWQKTRAARIAAIALLGVTLLKLFLHDLAELGQLYRVAALVAVAVVAIAASFLYQRFAPSNK